MCDSGPVGVVKDCPYCCSCFPYSACIDRKTVNEILQSMACKSSSEI